ncbi:CocE/NonD family hydrolase [Mesorhizobium sp. YC-39]|uniref:CocE/NonD family hydrolase n=1 Tax=unclassified Mesorhizobium TaxID=325217 RepID=UPI0021E8DEE8|nr:MULTISPECIES: CocE/NonD family hydrolase [unclassified Mesorhizobium]MCV3211850.1 CocE/NonD family hydrolase [Mesorhizobium sp. YC-2]MCV3233573.1 CocE/NonD family hydrolase [Mesorhizobium sp. YC-39]
MKIASGPRPVVLMENVWIPLPDGTRLAAKIWLPEDAVSDPVPAIIDYIPYRKRDGTVQKDERIYPYFASHGYASIRLDIRGTGDSEGLFEDEYVKQEQDDAVDAIEWITRQSWCSGNVGMIGISWGGYSALQVAARRPKALKAIVTHCSADDRYADSGQYLGGCLLNDTLSWGTTLFVMMSQSPDPDIVGKESWHSMWMERLENARPTMIDWLNHQRRDDFWKHGSVCEDYGAIDCAVFAVGGWGDGLSNTVFRLLSNLNTPRKGLIGPWGHKYPHVGLPGPAIGFLQECLRWWDHWLKGKETGVMQEPMLRSWMLDSVDPAAHYDERPGHWVADPNWPSPHMSPRIYRMGLGRLSQQPLPEATLEISSPATVGIAGGEWCPYAMGGEGPEHPLDQRWDDGGSLIFDSELLTETTPILGAPIIELEITCDRPTAILAARLSDVNPSGEVTRVTYGLLNLSHRDGHEDVQPIEAGRSYRISLTMNEVGYTFPPGHRIRLSLSTTYWPIAFHAPERAKLTLQAEASHMHLPIRTSQPGDLDLRAFDAPEASAPMATTALKTGNVERFIQIDVVSGRVSLTVKRDDGSVRLDPIGTVVGHEKQMIYSVAGNDPSTARTEVYERFDRGRGAWQTTVQGRTVLTATKSDFCLQVDFDAFENGQRIFCKSWSEKIPRDLV